MSADTYKYATTIVSILGIGIPATTGITVYADIGVGVDFTVVLDGNNTVSTTYPVKFVFKKSVLEKSTAANMVFIGDLKCIEGTGGIVTMKFTPVLTSPTVITVYVVGHRSTNRSVVAPSSSTAIATFN